jgi:hypothetical protein
MQKKASPARNAPGTTAAEQDPDSKSSKTLTT